MRIGILTYHCVPNFGAQLQIISTVGYFKRMGHEPIVLHWFPEDLKNIYAKGRIPEPQLREHEKFTSDVLPLSNLCTTEDELIREVDRLQLDAIFAGSDALFKFQPERNRRRFSKRRFKYIVRKCVIVESLEGNPFWGGFLSRLGKKIPATAFSVSSQNCPYTRMLKREKNVMAEFLSNYNYITVRDEWTRKMVQFVTGRKDIPVTPDPVFSFNQNNYIDLPSLEHLKQEYGLSDKYALFSFSKNFIQRDYLQTIVREVEKQGLQPVALPMPEGCFDYGIEKKIELPLSPAKWYILIQNATCYIGERMHPIVVCLHNSIPFFCFDEYGTYKKSFFGGRPEYQKESSKTYLILQRAGLLENLFSYRGNEPFPSAKSVLDKILTFDKKKCSDFAQEYQKLYKLSMMEVLGHMFHNRS